jgi:hypothetical protein
MPAGVIISDKFWIVGPKFAIYTGSGLRPTTTRAINLKPDSDVAVHLAPHSGSASPLATPAAELAPRSTSAQNLKPTGRGRTLRPSSGSATEE